MLNQKGRLMQIQVRGTDAVITTSAEYDSNYNEGDTEAVMFSVLVDLVRVYTESGYEPDWHDTLDVIRENLEIDNPDADTTELVCSAFVAI